MICAVFMEERQEQIVVLLNRHGKVLVKELSEQFNVTEDCIRKDLAALEKKGLLKRTYGGAVSPRSNTHIFEVKGRKSENVAAKRAIAAKAVQLIHENDMVFLDISTTSLEIAKLILAENKTITVVTNMAEIIHFFSRRCNVQLISVGGVLDNGRDGFIGSMSIETISKFKYDLCFLGVVGVNVFHNEAATYDVTDGMTKSAILHASRRSYLLCENRKFQMDGNYNYATLDAFSGIITESPPSHEISEALKELDVEIL
ncbi:DeoR/GlpR family DNA-binding transcription regulator [[Clostridium] leptum]|nr:DeoR/GlpR family DNA-binding transcription regulator [[Clostridium] leptum]